MKKVTYETFIFSKLEQKYMYFGNWHNSNQNPRTIGLDLGSWTRLKSIFNRPGKCAPCPILKEWVLCRLVWCSRFHTWYLKLNKDCNTHHLVSWCTYSILYWKLRSCLVYTLKSGFQSFELPQYQIWMYWYGIELLVWCEHLDIRY